MRFVVPVAAAAAAISVATPVEAANFVYLMQGRGERTSSVIDPNTGEVNRQSGEALYGFGLTASDNGEIIFPGSFDLVGDMLTIAYVSNTSTSSIDFLFEGTRHGSGSFTGTIRYDYQDALRSESVRGRAVTWPRPTANLSSGFTELTINPIPEPATWAMMIAGFGLMGAALRWRAPAHAA